MDKLLCILMCVSKARSAELRRRADSLALTSSSILVLRRSPCILTVPWAMTRLASSTLKALFVDETRGTTGCLSCSGVEQDLRTGRGVASGDLYACCCNCSSPFPCDER